jgi:transcriptional regulator GlxA family with amidase domain
MASAPPGTAAADPEASRCGELERHLGGATKVAFLLGEDANVMDLAGPWEVFRDASAEPGTLFELYTVASAKGPLIMSGGLRVTPQFAVDAAPQPDVLVVPAHVSTEASRAWLREASKAAKVTLSVCTGAFHVAAVGLLDGLAATTHHLFFDAFEKAYPRVELRRTARFVDNGRIVTAGGLTAGIDAALHIVHRLHGAKAAALTARYLEYRGRGWRRCRP